MAFDHISGHTTQKAILLRALQHGRLAHAYLFEGPEGVGKRLMALALVRALYCQSGTGCGDCLPCRKVDHGNHPDLHLLNNDDGIIKIDDVRQLQRDLSYRPIEAQRKSSLIDGADAMNPAAANALLKTLEEPPGDALIILISDRPDSLLDTIRSRCQRVPFRRLSKTLIIELLTSRLGLAATEAQLLATLAEGSLSRALGQDRELYIDGRRSLLKKTLGLSPGAVSPLLALAQELAEDKERLPELLGILQTFYRDALLMQQGGRLDGLVNIDLLEPLQDLCGRTTTSQLLAKLDALADCRYRLQRNANRELALDTLLMALVA